MESEAAMGKAQPWVLRRAAPSRRILSMMAEVECSAEIGASTTRPPFCRTHETGNESMLSGDSFDRAL